MAEYTPVPREVQVGKQYRHCEGGTYQVQQILLDATGYEEKREIGQSVMYMQLYDGHYPTGTIWIRKKEDFLGTVDKDGVLINKFEPINDE